MYKKYSALGFTKKADRSVAIKGLEERLVRTFKTKGGYGVFDEYLQRSLLWQRDVATLDLIPYPQERPVPSWSWMAYSGPISYVEAPFDRVDWNSDIISPFSSESGHKQHWKVGQHDGIEVLRATARSLSMDRVELMKRVTFDQARMPALGDLRCVIIGVKRSEGVSNEAEHYILVITPAMSGLSDRYTRAGVGIVLSSHISHHHRFHVVIE